MLGDCLERMKEIPDGSVDAVITDPPYSTWSGGTSSKGLHHRWLGSIHKNNDGKIFKHNSIHVSAYIHELYRVLKASGQCYLMVNNKNLKEFLIHIEEAGFVFHNLLVWKKNNIAANRWYMKNLEYVLFMSKRPSKTINNPGTNQVLEFDIVRNRVHPTEKPVELLRVFVENSTLPGDVVIDPFMGSGSTGLACVATGRRFIGVEVDPEYFATCEKRLG